MGTYLEIRSPGLTDTALNELNQDWLYRTKDILLPTNSPNNGSSSMEDMIHLLTRKDIKDWAIALRNAPDKLKRMGLSSISTTKQIIIKLKDIYPTMTVLGSCDIKLSGSHYCYHILARVKSFIDLHKNVFKINEYEDLVEYIRYYEMVTTTNYCSVCKSLAKQEGVPLPLPKGKYSPELQAKIDKINSIKDIYNGQ